jgi:hypothetical protein
MKRSLKLLILLTVAAVAALADPLIDFTGGYGGTISSGGLGSAITGSNISISSLLALDVPQNSGQVLGVTSGALSFTTGTLTSIVNNGGGFYTYNYSGGGTFTITGNVPGAGITGTPTLLTGSFYDGSFQIHQVGTAYVVSFTGNGVDTKNADLLTYFGVPTTTQFTFAGFSIGANFFGSPGANGSFSATAFSTDVANTATPEPSAILITGTCLLFVGGRLRKRLFPKAS